MVELTAALRTEVLRMRQESGRSDRPIRIAHRPDGTFALEFDHQTDEDVSIADDAGGVTVIMSQALAEQLDGAVLHFRGLDARYAPSGLVVLPVRLGATRRQWVAPAPPSRTPLWPRSGRRSTAKPAPNAATQTASP